MPNGADVDAMDRTIHAGRRREGSGAAANVLAPLRPSRTANALAFHSRRRSRAQRGAGATPASGDKVRSGKAARHAGAAYATARTDAQTGGLGKSSASAQALSVPGPTLPAPYSPIVLIILFELGILRMRAMMGDTVGARFPHVLSLIGDGLDGVQTRANQLGARRRSRYRSDLIAKTGC